MIMNLFMSESNLLLSESYMKHCLFLVAIKQRSFNYNKTDGIETSLYGRTYAVVLIICFHGKNIIIQ